MSMKITQAIELTDRQRATLAAARARAGLSQAQLAAAVGVSRPMVAMVESGQKPAPADLLGKIAARLGLVFSAKITAELRRKKS
jgi:transcriptional regulator with XRE-family HTH domain